eukprot:365522-Chlamydomonas_euryale.AAC.6
MSCTAASAAHSFSCGVLTRVEVVAASLQQAHPVVRAEPRHASTPLSQCLHPRPRCLPPLTTTPDLACTPFLPTLPSPPNMGRRRSSASPP